MLGLATVYDLLERKKKRFSVRVFYITIADADIVSLKFLHTLFDKYLDHMLVNLKQNRCLNYTLFWAF